LRELESTEVVSTIIYS